MKLEDGKKSANDFIKQIRSCCLKIQIAGSIRRGKPEVHDIEICAIPKNLFRLKEIMDRQLYIKGRFPSKYSQIRYQSAKIDIFWCSKDNWGNIYLIRTGPWQFSKWIMGARSRQVGLRQRDGYLWRGKEKLSCPEERDVFRLLEIGYIKPNLRK